MPVTATKAAPEPRTDSPPEIRVRTPLAGLTATTPSVLELVGSVSVSK